MLARQLHFFLPQEADTANLAGRLAPLLKRGDCLLLNGQIGSGKSAFARSLIRARLGRMEDVPSPTFTLVQTYEDAECEIWHCDLYRITDQTEIDDLGLSAAFEQAICLIEWPEKLGREAPENALSLTFIANDNGHTIDITARGIWAERLRSLDV